MWHGCQDILPQRSISLISKKKWHGFIGAPKNGTNLREPSAR